MFVQSLNGCQLSSRFLDTLFFIREEVIWKGDNMLSLHAMVSYYCSFTDAIENIYLIEYSIKSSMWKPGIKWFSLYFSFIRLDKEEKHLKVACTLLQVAISFIQWNWINFIRHDRKLATLFPFDTNICYTHKHIIHKYVCSNKHFSYIYEKLRYSCMCKSLFSLS